MEVRPTLRRLGDRRWACSCGVVEGFGETPEDAYVDWLDRFQYRGPGLPINFFDGEVDSRETERSARDASNY